MEKTQTDEQYELIMERLSNLCREESAGGFQKAYFTALSDFIVNIRAFMKFMEEFGESAQISELKEWNHILYRDITGDNYAASMADPECVAGLLPEDKKDLAPLFAAAASEIYAMIPAAYEKNKELLLPRAELLGEIWSACSEDLPGYEELKEILYWYVWDYSVLFTEERMASQLNPDRNFFRKFMELTVRSRDVKYLYLTGEYISDNDIKMAEYTLNLPEETIERAANAYTEGFRRGFYMTGKSLEGKGTVQIRTPLGLESIVVKAMEQFGDMGLKTTMYRNPVGIHGRDEVMLKGTYGTLSSRQMWFDHRQDMALVMDKKLNSRRVEILKRTLEKYKEAAGRLAGPAVIETFGEKPFMPENKEHAPAYSDKQNALKTEFEARSSSVTNEYIRPDKRSYTIISFPNPEIGSDFAEIFDGIVKINTLDNDTFVRIQQCLIDALDRGEYVTVRGTNGNQTDLTVALRRLDDPDRETNFENCTADVNIPAGEVFTSPALKGTNGRLHVGEVFLEGLKYVDLDIRFEDGCVRDYSCGNYPDEKEGRRYIRDNVLAGHDSLPMGEFAIGTNTTAYALCRKYKIEDRMDILITEKTGPHFALGDTCYSHEEDLISYNPDGKAIVARENEISALRNTEPEKAYFYQHIDITIPYDEIGELSVHEPDGTVTEILKNGRFVLKGTEGLNEAL